MIKHRISNPRVPLTLLAHALLSIPILAASPQSVPVSPPDAEAWIRHTVPLPKQIEIKSKAVLPATGIRIGEPAEGDPLLRRSCVRGFRRRRTRASQGTSDSVCSSKSAGRRRRD
jgi:hypothetical protein